MVLGNNDGQTNWTFCFYSFNNCITHSMLSNNFWLMLNHVISLKERYIWQNLCFVFHHWLSFFIIIFLSQILNLNEWWAFTASENALASSHYWKNKFLSLQKKQWSFQYLDLEATCSGHSIIYCNFIHNFWSFEFLNLAVDQLKERRNKLRKRLNNGPHEILQKYLKKSKGRFIWQIFWSSVLFHLIACLFPTYKLFCFAVLALKLHPGKSDYFPIKHVVRSALNKIKCHCFSQL